MKKLLLIISIFIISQSLFAQTEVTKGRLMKVPKDLVNVPIIPAIYWNPLDSNYYFWDPTQIDSIKALLEVIKLNSDSLHYIITYKDSIVGNSTFTYNPGMKSLFLSVQIRNMGANKDTITVQHKDAWGNWTTAMTRIIDDSNGIPINNALFEIDNGVTKSLSWGIPYPGEFRIALPVTTGQAPDKLYVRVKLSN